MRNKNILPYARRCMFTGAFTTLFCHLIIGFFVLGLLASGHEVYVSSAADASTITINMMAASASKEPEVKKDVSKPFDEILKPEKALQKEEKKENEVKKTNKKDANKEKKDKIKKKNDKKIDTNEDSKNEQGEGQQEKNINLSAETTKIQEKSINTYLYSLVEKYKRYPNNARKLGKEGKVEVTAIIDAKGNLTSIYISDEKGTHPILIKATNSTLDKVKNNWKSQPTTQGMKIKLIVSYDLRDS